MNIKWSKYIPDSHKPHAKQLAYLALPHLEALYGGAAGGGKSDALLMGALAWCDCEDFSGIIFRRTFADMKLPSSILSRAKEWLAPFIATKEVKFVPSEHTFYFASGARLAFGYLRNAGSEHRYQSSEYQYVAFDELTHFQEKEYEYLFSRLRKVGGSVIPIKMRAACVDEGFVLTYGGWKDIKDIQIGDMVYSPNSNGILELKSVTHTYKYEYSDKLIRIKKKNLYMSITPNHRVMYKKFNSDLCELKEFENHTGKSIDIVRASTDSYFGKGISNSFGWDNDEFMKFIGIYLSDGSVNHSGKGYKVNITQCKGTYIQQIQDLLDNSPFSFCRCKNGDWQTQRKALHAYLKLLGKSHEKYVPKELLQNATKQQLENLFNWLVMGDGSIRGTSITYTTCSKKLAENIEEIGIRLGYKIQTKFEVLENPNHNNRYVIYLCKDSTTTKVDKNPNNRNDVSYEDYNGYVYCISVEDNQSFVIKQQGKIWLSGNSNPGGVGHVWVKSRFKITKGENGVWYGADPKIPFVPATIDDNPAIRLEEYEASLNKLGQVERERLRNGDWDVSERALFDDQWFYNRYVTKTRGVDTWYHLQPFESTDRIIVPEPELFVFTTIDSAASKKTGIKDISYIENKRPSHSVISTWGLTNKYDLLLLDNIRVQTTIPQLVNLICTNQRQWQPTYNIIEKNGPGEGVCQMAIQKGLPVRPVPTTRDKVQNSIAAQIRAEEGRIWLPAYRPWLKEWQEEVFVWTGSDAQPDDQVDCFSNAASHAMELAVGFERDSSLRQGLRRAIPTSALHNGIYSEKTNKIGGSETRHLARSIYSGKRYSGGLDYLR